MGRFISADWDAIPIPVPYADFGDPQTLNLYSYVRNLPTARVDADGHCCDWQAAWDAGTGAVRGIVSSATLGAIGAPRADDSDMSLAGQAAGTIIEGSAGMSWGAASPEMMAGGLLAEGPSGGTSTIVFGLGALGVVAGPYMTVGAAKNSGAIVHAMANRAGDFKPSTREGAIQNNAEKNGGQNKCERCGQELHRTQNKKGQTPPKNQLHVHHDPPIKEGGGKNSKPEVVCRDCHQNKIHGKKTEKN